MKSRFFGKYFMYKLTRFRGLAIAAAVLNFAALVLPAMELYNSFSKEVTKYNIYHYTRIVFDGNMFRFAFLAMAAMSVILVITPVLSFKYYNSRSSMDTLGCLPLTYKERFYGDFFSGLAANLITFIPFSAVGAIITATATNKFLQTIREHLWAETGEEFVFPSVGDNLLKVYAGFALMLLLEFIAAYVVSAFVTSCCGRSGSSLLYSAIALIVPAGIVSTYGTAVIRGAAGVAEKEISNAIMAIPPAGMWIGSEMKLMDDHSIDDSAMLTTVSYVLDHPVCIAIALIITAAFFVGAYFLGKHRKAERVSRDFAYNGAYQVIALSLCATVIGFYFIIDSEHSEAYESGSIQHIASAAAIGLLLYVVLELVHTRSVKRLPKSLLRFAGLYAVCFGFLFAASKTDGFGIATNLPAKDKISSVKIDGTEFYNPVGEKFVYSSEEAIDMIYSEHEKLIQNRGSLQTGDMLKLDYVLNDGTELHREYSASSVAGQDLIQTFCGEIKKNVTADSGLGFIDDPRYDKITEIEYYNYDADEVVKIRSDACDELVEALRGDMLEYSEELRFSCIGDVHIYYTQNGVEKEAGYRLNEKFERTLAVLEGNITNDSTAPTPDTKEFRYYIQYMPDRNEPTPVISSLNLFFMSTDDSEEAKTVKDYLSPKNEVPIEERSERWYVNSGLNHHDLCVKKSDENAMLLAALKLTEKLGMK